MLNVEANHPAVGCRPAVTFPAIERYRPSAGTKLYCLVIEAHACEQLAQSCYLVADRPRFEPVTFWVASERSTVTQQGPSKLQYSYTVLTCRKLPRNICHEKVTMKLLSWNLAQPT